MNPGEIYSRLTEMRGAQRAAVFAALSDQLGKKTTQIRDFFYNTWTRLISADASTYEAEIRELLKQHSREVAADSDMVVREVCAQISACH